MNEGRSVFQRCFEVVTSASQRNYLHVSLLQEELMSTWDRERSRVGKVQELKEKLDALKVEIDHAERGYDLNKAAELKYSVLPKLQVRMSSVKGSS